MEEAINDDDFHPDLTAGSLACRGQDVHRWVQFSNQIRTHHE